MNITSIVLLANDEQTGSYARRRALKRVLARSRLLGSQPRSVEFLPNNGQTFHNPVRAGLPTNPLTIRRQLPKSRFRPRERQFPTRQSQIFRATIRYSLDSSLHAITSNPNGSRRASNSSRVGNDSINRSLVALS